LSWPCFSSPICTASDHNPEFAFFQGCQTCIFNNDAMWTPVSAEIHQISHRASNQNAFHCMTQNCSGLNVFSTETCPISPRSINTGYLHRSFAGKYCMMNTHAPTFEVWLGDFSLFCLDSMALSSSLIFLRTE
jgi:hypothetical protein